MSIAFEIAHSPRLSSSQAALSPALGHKLGPNRVNKYVIKFMNRGTKQQIRNQHGIEHEVIGEMWGSKKESRYLNKALAI